MTKALAAVFLISIGITCPQPKSPGAGHMQRTKTSDEQESDASPFRRRYLEGEKLSYHMKGANEGWRYEIDATAVVKRNSEGKYYEEFSWSNLSDNRPGDTLPAAVSGFRQIVSLDPGGPIKMPDLRPVLMIVGPVTDLLTFYADLRMALALKTLVHSGDHSYVKVGRPNSWADGAYVLTGEDSIDFDFTLKEIDKTNQSATLLVRHVPPEKPQIRLPAPWMSTQVAGTPNNWVEVTKHGEAAYVGAVGKETFEVEIKVSLADGKILSVKMHNPVEVSERKCDDRELTHCGEPRRYQILRQIEMTLEASSPAR